jgi:hypothetical protein
MSSLRPTGLVQATLLLLSLVPPAGAQSADTGSSRPHKSVYGTLQSVDTGRNAVVMKSDGGERLAWRFPAPVVAEVSHFKPGDPMIVIYRQVTTNEKRVTAVAFPGTAPTPQYVNMTDARVLLRSAPGVGGACDQPDLGTITESMIAAGGVGEATGGCWCCARPDQSCRPGNKTGLGKALLVSCFE